MQEQEQVQVQVQVQAGQDRTGYNTCKLGKCQKADGTNEATANFNLSMR